MARLDVTTNHLIHDLSTSFDAALRVCSVSSPVCSLFMRVIQLSRFGTDSPAFIIHDTSAWSVWISWAWKLNRMKQLDGLDRWERSERLNQYVLYQIVWPFLWFCNNSLYKHILWHRYRWPQYHMTVYQVHTNHARMHPLASLARTARTLCTRTRTHTRRHMYARGRARSASDPPHGGMPAFLLWDMPSEI